MLTRTSPISTEDLSRSTAPVVDITRWGFFDYAENFNDVFFMSLMFFVSGLFVYPAIRRHGTLGFIRDRFVRLGLPFAFAIFFLMPVAYYASWQLTGKDAGFLDFYRRLATPDSPPVPRGSSGCCCSSILCWQSWSCRLTNICPPRTVWSSA